MIYKKNVINNKPIFHLKTKPQKKTVLICANNTDEENMLNSVGDDFFPNVS